MRPSTVVLVISIFWCGACHSADLRPEGKNCNLSTPPADAGELEFVRASTAGQQDEGHDALVRVYPRAKDIDAQYTGCQVLMGAEGEGKWGVLWLTEIIQGDPVREWAEGGSWSDPIMRACRFKNGKLLAGDIDVCPAEVQLLKSMAPGCVRGISEGIKLPGLGTPWAAGCPYE